MEQTASATPVSGWRLTLGIALLALSLIGPLIAIPVVSMLGLSPALLASLSGAVFIGAEVLLVGAVAVMGKSGYDYIKDCTSRLLRRYGPPAEVSRTRYHVGLVFFVVPLFFGWIAPYVQDWIPFLDGREVWFALAGDVLLLFGLVLLGGDFWDKLRALFIHGAKATFPDASTSR